MLAPSMYFVNVRIFARLIGKDQSSFLESCRITRESPVTGVILMISDQFQVNFVVIIHHTQIIGVETASLL